MPTSRHVTKSRLLANFTGSEKDHTINSNPLENRGKILKVQLSEKAILTIKKACSTFP